jgi:hypothetical protein
MSTDCPEYSSEGLDTSDEILAEVWEARDRLLEMHGGLHGLVAFLERAGNVGASKVVQLPPANVPTQSVPGVMENS